MSARPDPRTDNIVWISKSDNLPQRCCTCGMYTDKLTKATHTSVESRAVSSNGTSKLVLGCLLHLLLGPIGWLISLMFQDDESATTTKTTKHKHQIKMPQCLLCRGQYRIAPLTVDSSGRRFAFQVHPEFIRHFENENSKRGN